VPCAPPPAMSTTTLPTACWWVPATPSVPSI